MSGAPFFKPHRQSNAKRAEYKGYKYMSQFEAEVAQWLDSFITTGEIIDIKKQHRLTLDVNGKHITTHLVDFLITLKDGRQKFVEAKGFAEELWRIKWKLTEACYPDIPYLIYYQNKPLPVKELLK